MQILTIDKLLIKYFQV